MKARRVLASLAACLAVACVAARGGSMVTAAAWTDEVHTRAAVTAGQACTDAPVQASPLRASDSGWDEVGRITLMAVPEECAGLPVVVSVHDYENDVPVDVVSVGPAVPGQMDVALNVGLFRKDFLRATVTFESWPVIVERNSPVVAVGSGAVWSSHDGGVRWDTEAALSGVANAVATDGAGNWVAVGSNGTSGPRIWRSTAGALGNWQVVDLTTADTDPTIANLTLTDVATDGRGTWVAVGGSTSPSHRAAVWTSADNGVTWTALPSGSIEGSSKMEAVATDGTTWVAGGWAQNGTGSIWHTATPTVGASWTCETGNVADSTTCDRNGPSAPVLGVATDGLERWVAVGYSAPGSTSVPCRGAWRATSADLTLWTGSQLRGGTAANCTSSSEQGWDVAADPATGVWLATGSGSGTRGVWRSLNLGQTWSSGSSFTITGRTVATDQEGLWLVGASNTVYQNSSILGNTWKAPTRSPSGASIGAPLNDIAFDQSLPMR